MFAIRRELLDELLKSEGWRRRLEAAESWAAVSAVLQSFCEERGLKVKTLTYTQRHFLHFVLLAVAGLFLCLLVYLYMHWTGYG